MERPRLFAELEAGTAAGVTLISAPAGSGKTALLSSWIASGRAPYPAAWVTVERGEADAVRFWRSLVEALREAGAIDATDPLATLAPAPLGDTTEYGDRLLAGLQRLPTAVVLVVDDLHELSSPQALRTLERLIEQPPARMPIALVTRRDPKLGLHRLRLEGSLTEIRAADLEFTPEEADELLVGAGVELEPAELAKLHARTEGWAAGLRLAALSLARHEAPARFVAEFSGSERTVADYLLAEVLARQDDDARELLLTTSILERVTAELADELSGRPGSARLLSELEEANAFVTAVDVGRRSYRYHQLLADLLRLELQRTWPERVPELHKTAARRLADEGEMTQAIRHAEQAKDWDLSMDLLARHWVDLLLRGEETTLRSLLARLPAEVVEHDAEAATITAADRLAESRFGEADRLLDTARGALHDVATGRRRRAEVGLATVELLRGRRLGGVEQIEGLDALLRGDGLDPDLQALAMMNVGIAATWALRLPEARAHLEAALELGRRAGRPHIEVSCLANLGFVANVSHDLVRAEELLREAIDVAERVGWSQQPIVGVAYMGLGQVLVDRGRHAEGAGWLARADPLLASGSEAAATLALRHAQGMVAIASGNFEEALARWEEAERVARTLRSEHFLAVAARQWQLRARLGLGELDIVEAAVRDARARGEPGAEWLNLEARRLLASGDAAGAAVVLEPVLAGEAPVYHVNLEIEALMLDALARAEVGGDEAARQSIERMLGLAEPQGRMWMIATIPGVEALLREQGLHQTAHAAFLTDLLDHLSGRDVGPPGQTDGLSSEPLTERELAVLRFLPTNLSAPEIGNEMFLSVHTVKTYMRRLYAKLDAHTRAEAVQRARAAGLLGPGRR